VKPAREKGADYIPEAANEIVARTKGYPYFLQEWGKHSWNIAKASPITLDDVKAASKEAVAALDESFFRVRFDRLTPKEKQYLRAMAELGPGPHRSGDIATILRKPMNSLGPLRSSLRQSRETGDRELILAHWDWFRTSRGILVTSRGYRPSTLARRDEAILLHSIGECDEPF